MLELLEQEQTCVRRQQMSHRLRGRVRAMRRAEGVVDIEILPVGELAANAGSFFVSPGIEARVLEHAGRGRRGAARAAARRRARSRTSPCPPRSWGGRDASTRRCPSPPGREAACSVGRAARIRVSSATRPPSSGTFKSARTRTRFPVTSASSIERGSLTGGRTNPAAELDQEASGSLTSRRESPSRGGPIGYVPTPFAATLRPRQTTASPAEKTLPAAPASEHDPQPSRKPREDREPAQAPPRTRVVRVLLPPSFAVRATLAERRAAQHGRTAGLRPSRQAHGSTDGPSQKPLRPDRRAGTSSPTRCRTSRTLSRAAVRHG